MSTSHTAPFTIDEHAFPAVVRAGADIHEKQLLRNLQQVGADIHASFECVPTCTAVISRTPGSPVQYTCTCGYKYGGACEHVVAAMLAVNSQRAVQVGFDFEAMAREPVPVEVEPELLPTGAAEVERISTTPTPRLYLEQRDGFLLVELRFAYDDTHGSIVEFSGRDHDQEKLVVCRDGAVRRIVRSRLREIRVPDQLLDHGLEQYSRGFYTPAWDPGVWVEEDLSALSDAGFEVFGQEKLLATKVRTARPSLGVSVRADGDFFSVQLDATFDGVPASMGDVFQSVMGGTTFVRLSDGSTGRIPDEWIQRLSDVLALVESASAPLRVRRAAAPALLEALDAIAQAHMGSQAESVRAALRGFDGVTATPLPAGFAGTLRPYQQAGYDWLHFLRRFNLGGCLADDMGLGKTVQTLALLLHEHEQGTKPRTSLLVVPNSLMFNWERESKRFTPGLRILRYHGPDRKRYSHVEMAFADIVLTTYGTVLQDSDILGSIRFNYIILDESQAIKNPLSDSSQKIRRLQGMRRLALSGTPIENGLSELWSLFTFLNPGMLGTYRHFSAHFVKPIQSDPTSPRAQLLRGTIKPCVLRRTKRQVATDLPPKTETVLTCTMDGAQRTLYDITCDLCRAQLATTIHNKGIEHSHIEIVQGLLRLRQICVHPALVDTAFRGDSCKFTLLFERLDGLIADGHRVLIFSQFVTALELLRTALTAKGIRTEILTGKTTDRQGVVDRFQNDDTIPIMLISLKAGGTGLNLTAADYVVHLDPWWNPASENQASDRAYRIGQTRPVFVYKLIVRDSVEERVLLLQQSKQAVFDAVISTEASVLKQLTEDDVLRLFSTGSQVDHP